MIERKRKYARAGMWNDHIQSPFLLFVEGEGKPKHITKMQFLAYCRWSGGKQWISKEDGNGQMRDYYIAGDTDLYWDGVYSGVV